jgi:hypothetical protein
LGRRLSGGVDAQWFGENRSIDAPKSLEVTHANEFFAGEFDSDLLFDHEAVDCHDDRDNEGAAQNEELCAGAQISKHGRWIS